MKSISLVHKYVCWLKVLKNALTVLHTWELNVANKLLSEDDFLTKQTAEGLKITIKSTIELTNYLLDECNFAYVLTSKTNQDCLEVIIKYLLLIIMYIKLLIS